MLIREILLHHDNTRPHTARLTQDKIENFLWKHPSYSPNLPPINFHLFGQLKIHLNGKRFATDADTQREIHKWLRQQFKDFYTAGIGRLIKI
ncbi:hypothetical protein AVEN_27236-1 [Araneus ventricosus]|uniref:Histone-lysine N-methyltransferase SETMAR n=1 Tax=Araneus ventricosus TaxID=182803 RepID=A0A4Y2CB97_ARAVE|nr:hypothetical protein AVEN_27236-1 [Araneus ventricosus]